ncbi:MAG: HDOD domain-containing protein [Gammaproteobacteria bacterium]|nr:HDOD domain-containing protein [Gammaproteobacteria bacterium]
MIEVLFVDDEEMILDGLRRSLRPMRNSWHMRFACGGRDAIELLEKAPADVVVSDIRMPGMNGAELLRTVAERWPATMRVVLSGEADKETAFSCSNVTHRFLAKPCDIDALKEAVGSAINLRQRLDNSIFEASLGKLTSIPSLPAIYQELTVAIDAPDCSADRIGAIIEKDPAMTAKLLKLVNSAYFSPRTAITRADTAASMLGLGMLRELIIAFHIFEQMETRPSGRIDLQELWQYSERVAQASSNIARLAGYGEEACRAAFGAGLLHEVGALLLAMHSPCLYDIVMTDCAATGADVCEVEKYHFSIAHTTAGAYLLSLWGLPQSITFAVEYHHAPGTAPAGIDCESLAAVHIATHMLAGDTPWRCVKLDEDYIADKGLQSIVEQARAELA